MDKKFTNFVLNQRSYENCFYIARVGMRIAHLSIHFRSTPKGFRLSQIFAIENVPKTENGRQYFLEKMKGLPV